MSIKIIYKKAAVILLAVVVLFIAVPVTVFAAPNREIIYKANTFANAGDTINVTISTTEGFSISTLGLRLYYDKEKLAYQRSQWAEDLQNSNSSMTLVSDVAYNGSQVLNISMIADGGYQSGNTLVTLVFTVKEGYTENPFRLELREITDENLQSVEATTRFEPGTGNGSGEGTGSSGEETNFPETGTGSSDENAGSHENSTNGSPASSNSTNTSEPAVGVPAASSTDTITTPAATNTIDTVNTANSTNAADTANNTNTAASANHPKTFQTGIEDFGTNLLFAGAVFGLVGIICIMIRRKLSR